MPQEHLVQFHHVCGDCVNISYIMFTALNVYAEPSSFDHYKRLQEMAADVIGSPNSGAIVWGSSDQKIVQSEIRNNVRLNLRRLSQTRSIHWWEIPPGCGEVNGRVLTFDSTALYPQLWINDSKRPYPRGLMHSARLQAGTEEAVKNVTLMTYSHRMIQ